MRRGQTILAPDGNKAWKSEAVRCGLHVQGVHHQVKNSVSKKRKQIPGLSNYAGIQYIDRSWRSLKEWVCETLSLKAYVEGYANYTPMWAVGAGVRQLA